jgi:FkbM family methyltransferase
MIYTLNNILGEELQFNVHNSVTEKGISNYTKIDNKITFIDICQETMDKLFGEFEHKKLTVLDIGANGGMFSFYCVPMCEKIYAIEPSAVLCSAIREFGNDFKNIVVCNNSISNEEGMRYFYFFPDCTGQSTIHNRQKANNVDALVTKSYSYTILSFIKNYKIDYVDICKVDIEGEEVNIFSEESIKSLSPYVDKFWIEVHNTLNINGKLVSQNYSEITSRFKKLGYKLFEDKNQNTFIARR